MVSGQPALPCAPGDWLVHYTYDALGRLIRKQTPIRDDTTSEQLAVRTERYFYDGARRIQEVVTDPIVIGDPGEPGGGEIPIEEEMLEPGSGGTGGGSGGTGGSGGGGGVLINSPYVDREYVYVPSGASGYVDEFICQIDRYQDLWYILQDVNYNVIALTDSGGDVVRQHTFDPYGEILTAEDFDTHPGIKVGHQGLFFDRLEPPAPAVGLISMSAAVQLQPGVFGLYQARNRVLLPRYGRWAQKDPNASGMLHASLWHSGMSPIPSLAAGSLDDALRDGSNLFAFVGNNPFNSTDAMGLFGFVQGLMTGLNMFDTMTDVLDQAKTGVETGASFIELSNSYQDALLDAIEWAMDPDAAWDELQQPYEMEFEDEGLDGGYGLAGAMASLAKAKSPGGTPGPNFVPKRKGVHGHRMLHHRKLVEEKRKWRYEGVEDVKINKEVRHPVTGKILKLRNGKGIRPDVQGVKDGKLQIFEYPNTQSRQSLSKKKQDYINMAKYHGIEIEFVGW